MQTSGITSNAAFIAARLVRDGAEGAAKATKMTFHYGAMMQARVKANASGRPGPNIVFGDYRRSIALITRVRGVWAEAIVGTNRPQGRRLEYGFVGADSLGRVYNQKPYPHWEPAQRAVEPLFRKAVAKAVVGR